MNDVIMIIIMQYLDDFQLHQFTKCMRGGRLRRTKRHL